MNRYFFIFLLLFQFSIAQTLSSSLSKQKIDLGEIITMKISVQNLQGKEVISAPQNGLLPFGFEEYSDDIQQDKEQYIRTITFTILDEGKHHIPALEFKIGDEIQRTIPYEIEVINPALKNDEIKDIMPNQEIELGWADYWGLYRGYILGFLGILGSIFLVILWKKGKKYQKKDTLENPEHWALAEIAILEQKHFIENEEFRLFYIELLEIIRRFLAKKHHIPAHILLTDDLLNSLKSTEIAEINQKMLGEIFMRGDLAKFAKITPNREIMELDLTKIKNWITEK